MHGTASTASTTIRTRATATAARVITALLGLALAAPASAAPPKVKKCPYDQAVDAAGFCVGMFGCPEGMIPIPAESFTMGKKGAKDDQGPAHLVSLKPYCIDRTEVTARAWRACVDAGACKAPSYDAERCNALHPERDDHPANCVTWEGANAYCRWAGKRLPTEAEWELAARGKDERLFPWGKANPGKTTVHASMGGGRLLVDTAPVGSYPKGASPFGALDMSGNVCELVADYHADRYPDAAQRDPKGPATGTFRVCRGGSLNNRDAASLATTFRRRGYSPGSTDELTGVRCAAAPKP